jgi:hypothetical protein
VPGASDLTSLVPNVPGTFANAFNIGRNNPDGWTVFNGLIGDIFVYRSALNDTERQALEADLQARFVAPGNLITSSAGTGGTINPTGTVLVPSGSGQRFTISPNPGFAIASLQISGTTYPSTDTYTFTNVTSDQTIAATFSPSDFAEWRVTHFGANWNNPVVSGDSVDIENDGIGNLLEYALGNDPKSFNSNPLSCVIDPSGRFTVSFLRSMEAQDVTLTIQGAESLKGPWTNLARSTHGTPTVSLQNQVAVSEIPANAQLKVEIRDSSTSSSPVNLWRFLRLEATR